MIYVSAELTRLAADPDHYTTILFGGLGTAAVESMLGSAADNDSTVIINSGGGDTRCQQPKING